MKVEALLASRWTDFICRPHILETLALQLLFFKPISRGKVIFEVDCFASGASIAGMSTTLTIRNLDETVKRKLRIRAATHGRSMEAEVRAILAQTLETSPPPPENPVAPVATEPEEAKKSRFADMVGIWKGRMTTDELMHELRGDDLDNAYPR